MRQELASGAVDSLAPSGHEAVDYDRRHLAVYAALLEADDAGEDWRLAATTVLAIDCADSDAERCWRSHLERARWIVGEGMSSAIENFGKPHLLAG